MRAVSLMVLCGLALCAEGDNWDHVREIFPGQLTHVHGIDGHLQSGSFVSAPEAAIIIRGQKGDETVRKEQVRKVSVRTGGKRWRNAAIGAVIGAGIGVALTARPCPAIRGYFEICGARGATVVGYRRHFSGLRHPLPRGEEIELLVDAAGEEAAIDGDALAGDVGGGGGG
jgi:hypothetical protein